MSDSDISLRPVKQTDIEFLYRLYASTRVDELAQTGWNEEEKDRFLRMQFDAQSRHYADHFADADFQLVCLDGEPIGRLYVDRRPGEFRIVDIIVLPEFRSRGVGTKLLRDILAEAHIAQMPVRIHVERFNPALRLYGRLGFSQVGDNGVYLLLERAPDSVESTS